MPARGGDAVRLFLAHRAIPGAAYTTLASTLLVMTIFDSTMAVLLFAYALTLGVLPGFDVLANLPGFEFGWFLEHGAVLARSAAGARDRRHRRLLLAARCGSTTSSSASAQGFAVLSDRRRYLRTVAAWQAGDWLLRFVAIWFFLGAFGIEQSLRNVLLVQVTQSLATLVPISPGGIGTEQAFIVYVFKGTVASSAAARVLGRDEADADDRERDRRLHRALPDPRPRPLARLVGSARRGAGRARGLGSRAAREREEHAHAALMRGRCSCA